MNNTNNLEGILERLVAQDIVEQDKASMISTLVSEKCIGNELRNWKAHLGDRLLGLPLLNKLFNHFTGNTTHLPGFDGPLRGYQKGGR